MAVFQRAENRLPGVTVAAAGFSFADFEREMLALDAKLKPGGLLFLDHCDFRFEDTAVAAGYEPLLCPANQRLRERPVFGPDNTLLVAQHVANRIFTKRAAAIALTSTI